MMRTHTTLFKGMLWKPAVLLLIGLLHSSCSGQKEQLNRNDSVPVIAGVVEQKTVPVQLHSIANVEAYSVVAIKARIGGQITKIYFREGHDVKQGEVLFTIDKRPYEVALQQAQANLARDQIQAKKADEDVPRYEDLLHKEYVTQEQFDQVRTTSEALKATVKADEAVVENARLQLSYCTITAPISGRTGSLYAHAGNLIKGNDDDPMVVIHQITPVYVNFAIPEKYLAEIKKHWGVDKIKVGASVNEGRGDTYWGELTFIDNAVDQATGTIKLKGTFANDDRALWPGQFVDVTLNLQSLPNAVVVPSRAIQTGQQGQYVFVIKPDLTVESRSVVVKTTYQQDTVVEKGLEVGEKVVTDGQLRLAPGMKVEIKSIG